MIQYPNFYRSFVVRMEGQFKNPPLPRLHRLELPPLALVHYVPQSSTSLWPTEDWFMYQKNDKPIRITHHMDLVDAVGGPKLRSGDFNGMIRDFRRRNPRFKAALELQEMKLAERQVVTENYGLLFERWKYQRSMFSNINRWTNIFNTVFSNAGAVVGSGYNQYFEIPMPKQLPKKELLDKTEQGWTTRNMVSFNSYPMLMLHHLWVWLGENRHKGAIAKYFKNGYKGVHLIMREGDRFTILDMERINSWRKPSMYEQKLHAQLKKANPTEQVDPLPSGTFGPVAMQKAFLRMCMALMETRAVDVPENLGDAPAVVEEGTADKALDDIVQGNTGDAAADKPQTQSATVDGEVTEEEAFAGYDRETDMANLMAEIDKDIEALDVVGADGVDENAEDSLAANDDVDPFAEATEPAGDESEAVVREVQFFPEDPTAAFKEMCARAAKEGNISANDYRKMMELAESSTTIEAPLGQKGTIGEFIKIAPEQLTISADDPEIQIPDQKTILDKSMLKSTLQVMDKRYAEEILQKDVAGMVMQLQSAGYAIKSYDVQEVEDITGTYFEYTVHVKPIEGASSVLRFKLPKVNEDGNFNIAGVPYRLRKQRGELPIRKIGPSRISLTSYYGKINIERSSRRVNDYYKWITNSIMAQGLDTKNEIVTALVPGNAFGPDMQGPRLFTAIAQVFRAFNLKVGDEVYHCSWDATKAARLKMPGAPLVVGKQVDGDKSLLMDLDDNLIIMNNGAFSPGPRIEEILGLNILRAPVEFAEMKVLAKVVPVGVVLGYLLGLDNLIKLLKPVSMREVPTGKRVNLEGDEWQLVFDDKTYVFSRSEKLVTMILGGWREIGQTTSRYPAEEFNSPDIYFNVFEDAKLGDRTLRELDLLQQMFIDPITRELLREMNEPVVFTKLLMRAGELLCNDEHPSEQDTRYMRIKGYERFAGAVYGELVRSARIHNSRPGKHRYGMELNPYAVWINIQQDPAKDQVSEINPIQNLKEQEAVTYSGTGGRNSRSMVKSTRVYHRNDMGVISESTVDSGDVAINVFTSANPKFNSLRGTADAYSFEKDGASSLLSTSALVSPGSTKDDPKRVNFIGIQNRHVVACQGYQQPWLRTGYEQVIPHRVGDLFAVTAKKPGKVVSRNDSGIVVEYVDGKRQGISLGRRFGNAAGLTIPHQIHSDMKEGDAFEVGEPIAWNTGFFERDVLNPRQIIWKSATMARVVLLESPDTLEDSSAISNRLSAKLITEQVKIKDIVVNFDQAIHKLVNEGQALDPESILCYIEDEISARASDAGLDDQTLDTLRVLSAQTPQAKIQGKVDRIEVFYNGELEDMSPSLRKIASASDKRIAARNISIGRKAYTGSVGGEFRIGADPLMMDTACIRIYMSALVPAGVGDKGVFCNQMKTVFGRVFPDNVRTESGLPIDAIFGAKSVDDRVVISPDLIGTVTTLLMVGSARVVKAYRG